MAVRRFSEDQIDGDVAKAMLAQSPQCIKLLDPDGRLRFMSENGRHLMEIDDFALIEGKDWWALWPEESRETLRGAVAAARRGLSVDFEAECPTGGGTLKHWAVRVSPVIGGDLDGMIVAASEDISDRMALRTSRDRLETDNRMLRRFGRFVAHDLRGPIRHHRLLSEMIVDSVESAALDDGSAVLAARIRDSASTLLDLLSGLESLHEIGETGTQERETVRLSDVVEHGLAMVTRENIQLTMTGADPRLVANRGQMISVFANLLDNARKYTPSDRPCRVVVDAALSEDGTVTVTLSDDGPGFASDRLDDVFEPLVRQSNGTGIEGAGLGLALVDRIVSTHGGTAAVVPHPAGGTGATIRMTFPTPTA